MSAIISITKGFAALIGVCYCVDRICTCLERRYFMFQCFCFNDLKMEKNECKPFDIHDYIEPFNPSKEDEKDEENEYVDDDDKMRN